jgi:hypothetical protein
MFIEELPEISIGSGAYISQITGRVNAAATRTN